ncbi:hypothetical protein BH20ACT14_BH20ACT14_11920 [soil metagenome]
MTTSMFRRQSDAKTSRARAAGGSAVLALLIPTTLVVSMLLKVRSVEVLDASSPSRPTADDRQPEVYPRDPTIPARNPNTAPPARTRIAAMRVG